MHPYSLDNQLRKCIYIVISCISISVPIYFDVLINFLGFEFISFTLTFGITFSILFFLVDKYLWKIFKFVNMIPNLEGKWNVIGKSSFKDEHGENYKFNMEIEIKQTLTSIEIFAETERQAREANKKPKIETVHEWDERFAHDRTNQIKATTTHGMSHTDLYKTWQNMKKVYTVCDEWQTFEPFQKVVEQEYAQYTEEQAARVYPLIVGVPIGPTNYKIESKYQHEVKSGVARVVEKLNQDGEVVAEYSSVVEAAKAVDGIASKISAVCKGTRKTHAGFKWRYKE